MFCLFLTAILHRGLRNDFFFSFFNSDLLFPIFVWTFISLFYMDFYFPFLFGIFFFNSSFNSSLNSSFNSIILSFNSIILSFNAIISSFNSIILSFNLIIFSLIISSFHSILPPQSRSHFYLYSTITIKESTILTRTFGSNAFRISSLDIVLITSPINCR